MPQHKNKSQKVALVTGASKGIGKALAKQLLEENYFVIGTCRSGQISDLQHENLVVFPLDLSDSDSIQQSLQSILAQFNGIDILINNAGTGPDLGAALPDENSFQRTFDVNVRGTVFFTEGLVNSIRDNGMILNISSKMGSVSLCGRTGSIAYSMSKSALNMYSKLLANRAERGIRIANIHPGWVQTDISPYNDQAPLTPKDSADRIYKFMVSDFQNGVYWDAEATHELTW